jgi:hypothetical protein
MGMGMGLGWELDRGWDREVRGISGRWRTRGRLSPSSAKKPRRGLDAEVGIIISVPPSFKEEDLRPHLSSI